MSLAALTSMRLQAAPLHGAPRATSGRTHRARISCVRTVALAGKPAALNRRTAAWVGDSALDVLLGLVALRYGFEAREMNELKQELFSNAALARHATDAHVLCATDVEAAVGTRLAEHAPELEALLAATVRATSPQLLNEIKSAVAKKRRE